MLVVACRSLFGLVCFPSVLFDVCCLFIYYFFYVVCFRLCAVRCLLLVFCYGLLFGVCGCVGVCWRSCVVAWCLLFVVCCLILFVVRCSCLFVVVCCLVCLFDVLLLLGACCVL